MTLALLLACASAPTSTGTPGLDSGGSDGGASDGGVDGGASDGGTTGTQAVYDPAGPGFWDTPWPSDGRLDERGHPVLDGFPNPVAVPLLDTYLATLEEEVGFGTNTPVTLAFDGPVDLALLPSPEASLHGDAALFLVDVDPASPGHGQRHPVQWRWQEEATGYEPAHGLAVAPVLGLPLRPETTYALVATTALAGQPAAFAADLDAAAHLAPLRDWLDQQGIAREQVAVASVFTTGDPLAALVRAREWVDAAAPAALDQVLDAHRAGSRYEVYTGHYAGPLFQEGERPYTTTGGGLVFDEPDLADGRTVDPVAWEELRLAVALPVDRSDPPAAGWPVAIVLHGTGGDYLSCCNADADGEHAAVLAAQGILTLSIDLPLHGDRGGELATEGITHPYNFLNPDSARSVLRQGAIDAMFLAHGLAGGAPIFTLPGGETVPVDPGHVFLLGHSQGGLSAQLALPFLGGEVQAVVSSGGGGGVAITLLDRTDPFSLQELLSDVLGLSPDEELHELHPVVGVVQWLSERTDPLNTGPWAFAEGGLTAGQAPVHFLQFSGMEDPISPARGSEALAAAAGTPVLAPAASSPVSWALAGIGEVAGPLQGNRPAFDGGSVTAALVQGEGQDHGYVYDDAAAWGLYGRFLGTAARGQPEIGW